jgi:hypothetical protein
VADPKRDVTRDSNDLLQQVDELRKIESAKRREPISSDRFHQLAEQVTALSRRIMTGAWREEVDGNRTERGDETIDDVSGRSGDERPL